LSGEPTAFHEGAQAHSRNIVRRSFLERLKLEGLGSKPPIAYRALGFLLENGFIHRIERLNAFVACSHPGAAHNPAFLICTDCGSVAETSLTTPSDALSKTAQQNGFQIQHTTLEAEGQCPGCQQAEPK